MPTTPSFEAISIDNLADVTGGCGKKSCKCPPPAPAPAPAAAPQLPPSDSVSVSVSVQQ